MADSTETLLNTKPHNQLYWHRHQVKCNNPNCERTKGMEPDDITLAGIPHQGYGYCSTCYGEFKKIGKLPKNLTLRLKEQEIYKIIGERIRRAREKQEVSQRQLAKDIGYKSTSTLSAIEKGDKRIQLTELQNVARVLHRDINYFFGADYKLPDLKMYLKEVYCELDLDEINELCKLTEALRKKKYMLRQLVS